MTLVCQLRECIQCCKGPVGVPAGLLQAGQGHVALRDHLGIHSQCPSDQLQALHQQDAGVLDGEGALLLPAHGVAVEGEAGEPGRGEGRALSGPMELMA